MFELETKQNEPSNEYIGCLAIIEAVPGKYAVLFFVVEPLNEREEGGSESHPVFDNMKG